MSTTLHTPLSVHGTPTREGAFGSAVALTCRACGASQPLGAAFACMECFGPLEVAYDFPTVTRADIERGPRSIWRYAPLLPVPADIASFPGTAPGGTRLLRAAGIPGLLLCSLGAERTALTDRADLVVDGPAGLVAWLSDLADQLETSSEE